MEPDKDMAWDFNIAGVCVAPVRHDLRIYRILSVHPGVFPLVTKGNAERGVLPGAFRHLDLS